MSLKHQNLRDLVVQRLVVAADEIFALFEQTFAQYEEEFLRTKPLREAREKLQTDAQSTHTGVQAVLVSPEIKYEDKETPLEVPFASFTYKPEENLNKSCLIQEEPALEPRPNPSEQLYGAEEPGCSLIPDTNEYEHYSCSDTDNSEDWEAPGEKKPRSNGKSYRNTEILSVNYENPENRQYVWTESDAFMSKQGVVQSQMSHREAKDAQDKPFICSVCKKSFPQKRNLKSHMRVHTGERPYHCVPCGISFKFQQNFCQHDLSVHRKDKPFRCRVCKKDFVDKNEMIAHRDSHDSSFSCSTCSKVFNCKKYLRRHMERCPRKKRTQRSFKM